MSENNNQGTLVNVKRVRQESGKGKNGDQEQTVLTFGLDKDGNNGLDMLLAALEVYRGKQVNFDIRISEKTSQRGTKFPTAFVIVKEMIPLSEQQPKTTFVPKQTRADKVKADAENIRKQFSK